MKAYLIDPMNIEDPVSEIEIGDGLDPIYAALSDPAAGTEVRTIETAFRDDAGNSWYVDEDGLQTDRKGYVLVRGAHQPFVGRAIVLCPESEAGIAAPDLSIGDLRAMTAVFRNDSGPGFGISHRGDWKVGRAIDLIVIAPDMKVASVLDALQDILDDGLSKGAEDPAP